MLNSNQFAHFCGKTIFFLAFFLFFAACKNDPPKNPIPETQGSTVNPALAHLSELLQKNPNNDSLRYLRAKVLYEEEGFDLAIQDLTAAIAIDSMKPQYYHLLADVFLDYAKSYQGMKTMEVAAAKFPENTHTLLKTSEVYLILKKYTEAMGCLDKILKRDPQNADAFYMTGRLALDMGEVPRAITAFKKSVAINSDNADAWEFLGRIYAQQGNKIALQYYDNALRIDSTLQEIHLYKAMFYKNTGDTKNATAIYRDLIDKDPQNADAWFDMGMIYLESDSLEQAKRHLDIAIKNDPIFVKAYYFRGHLAEKMGNISAAIADYEQALKMSPNFPEPKAALEKLKK